ncbi:MAG: D-2-hydroxyacid dehydrogenase [Acutalibacteraceae bacterium]
MKIVVLDGYTTNPGDISWAPIEKFGELTVYDYTAPDEIISRALEADIIINNKTVLTKEILSSLPRLKFIALLSTGFNAVDTPAAKMLNIPVANVPCYSTSLVAQHTFALILEHFNHVAEHSDSVHNLQWSNGRDFCYWKTPLSELDGKTIGIIGFGRIGRSVAKIADAFGMNVITFTRSPIQSEIAKSVSLSELLEKSDIVTLHCPLNDGTVGIINYENLKKMKKTAVLINTSRGGAVIDADLARALNEGVIAGAGLDVMGTEPPCADNPLLSAKNCIITPHIAWAAAETRTRLLSCVAQNIGAFLNGKPINIVNP